MNASGFYYFDVALTGVPGDRLRNTKRAQVRYLPSALISDVGPTRNTLKSFTGGAERSRAAQ